jgi:hypothetical protein
MSLAYPNTDSVVLIGSKTDAGIRTGIDLATTYSTTEDTNPTKSLHVAGYSKVSICGVYEMDAAETGNELRAIVESSPDGNNWYPIMNDSTSGETSTLSPREFVVAGSDGSTQAFEFFLDIAYEKIRVSFKESGVASNAGNVFAEATISGQ